MIRELLVVPVYYTALVIGILGLVVVLLTALGFILRLVGV